MSGSSIDVFWLGYVHKNGIANVTDFVSIYDNQTMVPLTNWYSGDPNFKDGDEWCTIARARDCILLDFPCHNNGWNTESICKKDPLLSKKYSPCCIFTYYNSIMVMRFTF